MWPAGNPEQGQARKIGDQNPSDHGAYRAVRPVTVLSGRSAMVGLGALIQVKRFFRGAFGIQPLHQLPTCW